jgi:cyclase
MSLATRVIPVLLKRGNSLVKGKRFDSWRSVGHPLTAARIHSARGVDELIVLDIGATPEGRGPDLEMVEKLTDSAFMPVTVGGGVRTLQDVRDLLNAGADKVAICTHTEVISQAAAKFGNQALCVGIDVLGKHVVQRCGRRSIIWRARQWARMMEQAGAGEILLQRVERDGMMEGYDLDLIRTVSDAVNIPVVASCGCGAYSDMVDAVRAGASAVAAGAFFQFQHATPKGASEYLDAHGIEARL